MTPTVGRIVHVNTVPPGSCRAALIADITVSGRLDLVVFGGRNENIVQRWLAVSEGSSAGDWHWPECEQELAAERKDILANLVSAAAQIEAIGADEPEKADEGEAPRNVRRYEVVDAKDVRDEIRRRARNYSGRASYAASDALYLLVDWLEEEIPS